MASNVELEDKIYPAEKIRWRDFGPPKYRGRSYAQYSINEKILGAKQFEEFAKYNLVDPKKENSAVEFSLPVWVTKHGSNIYSSYLVNNVYPIDDLKSKGDDHVNSGIVSLTFSQGTREYSNTLTGESRATEEILVETKEGEIVKPTFMSRTFEHVKGHDDGKVKHYEKLRITEIYGLSVDKKQGELHLTCTIPEGMPLDHEAIVHDINPNSIRSVILAWKFSKPVDMLVIGKERRKGDDKTPLDIISLDDKEKTIPNANIRSVKIMREKSFWMGEYTGHNKESLREIRVSNKAIQFLYGNFKGQKVLAKADSWSTDSPMEDGHVLGDGLRYGTTVGGCVAGNDILIEGPATGSTKRAYFQFDVSYLKGFQGLSVTEVKLVSDVAASNYNDNCRIAGINTEPKSRTCPDAVNEIFNDIANGTQYRTTNMPVSPPGGVSKVLGDRNPNTAPNNNACNDLESQVQNLAQPWFAVGIKKSNEATNTSFSVRIKGQEYDVAAAPKPTLEVLFNHT